MLSVCVVVRRGGRRERERERGEREREREGGGGGGSGNVCICKEVKKASYLEAHVTIITVVP